MAFIPNSVMLKTLDIKRATIEKIEASTITTQAHGHAVEKDTIIVHVRPHARSQSRCPDCHKQCGTYDHKDKKEVLWRANSWNGVHVYLAYQPKRIYCKEHGVQTEYIPWADGNTRFTESFNNEVTFLALTCPKTVVSQYMDINWRTVGNCIKATHDRMEPNAEAERLLDLRHICVDETSYHKGHSYITVVYDMDRNRVAWVHEGYGDDIFRLFCEAVPEEERKKMEIIAGDGAKWIDRLKKEYFPQAKRCVDFFHVVGWVNDVLDDIRSHTRSRALQEVEQLTKDFKAAEKEQAEQIKDTQKKLSDAQEELASLPKRGRPSKRKGELQAYISGLKLQLEELKHPETAAITEEEYQKAKAELDRLPKKGRSSKRKRELQMTVRIYEMQHSEDGASLSDIHQKVINDLMAKAAAIKNSKYALGKNPENLLQSQKDKLELIQNTCPDLYEAYSMKEAIRTILHMKEVGLAEVELDAWIKKARETSIKEFNPLAEKIERHRENILNAVRYQMNSSRSEATNTTVKALIATARGFTNLENLFALIYLRCSDIVIPLHNRYQLTSEEQKKLRDIQNARRHAREEARKAGLAS